MIQEQDPVPAKKPRLTAKEPDKPPQMMDPAPFLRYILWILYYTWKSTFLQVCLQTGKTPNSNIQGNKNFLNSRKLIPIRINESTVNKNHIPILNTLSYRYMP